MNFSERLSGKAGDAVLGQDPKTGRFTLSVDTTGNGSADLLVVSQSPIKQTDVIWNGQAPTVAPTVTPTPTPTPTPAPPVVPVSDPIPAPTSEPTEPEPEPEPEPKPAPRPGGGFFEKIFSSFKGFLNKVWSIFS